jgi:hypothetical protein
MLCLEVAASLSRLGREVAPWFRRELPTNAWIPVAPSRRPWLAPDIVEMIVEGRQPWGLTIFPVSWHFIGDEFRR